MRRRRRIIFERIMVLVLSMALVAGGVMTEAVMSNAEQGQSAVAGTSTIIGEEDSLSEQGMAESSGGTIDGSDGSGDGKDGTDGQWGYGTGDGQELDMDYKVEPTKADTQVIPDRYNTGCSGELTVLKMDTDNPMMVGGVLIIPGSNATRFVLDFYYRNKDISGTVYIENYDFSEHSLWSYNEDKVDRQIKLVFNNCKFSGVAVGKTDANLSFEFNNCTITNFSGSNSTFNRCQFGHTFSDGLVPFVDIEVNDCFFTDMAGMVTDKGAHIDGTQIYGIKGTDVENVSYNNCRFEIPALKPEGTAAYVNACIMLQLEFSNAKNLKFKDMLVNGGGYSIYAESKYDDFTFEDVKFEGIRFGDASKYGIIYPKVDKTIEITGVSRTDGLYVGSVWKEDGQTHFSVTNDTRQERTLLIYTDKGIYTYTIPACFVNAQFTSDLVYKDFPFDMDIVVPADCQYAVCYDNTLKGCGSQIRFVNWSKQDVYLTKNMVNLVHTMTAGEVLVSGTCGKNITFTLTKEGVLTLSGTGGTYNYHSAKFPEWVEYKDYIKEIVVEEGITALGSQIFRSCNAVEKVSLPDSLVTIGDYAFGGCVSIEEFTFPANIAKIGKSVLSGTVLRKVCYTGDDWDLIDVASGNDNWLERLDAPRGGLRVRLANKGEEYVYTGSAIKPAIIVTNNGEKLTAGVDYTVKYTNNVKASANAKITVTGKGNLTGSNSTTFTIKQKDIGDADVKKGAIVVVKGSKAVPVLNYNHKKLGTKDYTYANADKTKKFTENGTITVEGKGNFTGSCTLDVKVVDKRKKFTVTLEDTNLTYDGKGEPKKPTVVVADKSGEKEMKEGEDYEVFYSDNVVDAGMVKVTVIGQGLYTGTVTKSYTIKPLAVKEEGVMVVSGVDSEGYAFAGKAVTIGHDLTVICKTTKEVLTEGKDYKISYSNNKKVGTAKYTIKFQGNYNGSKALKGTFAIKPMPLSNAVAGLKIVVGDKVYSGKPGTYISKPLVSINGVMLKASDVKVTYYKDADLKDEIKGRNKISLEEGEASKTIYVKLVGKGNYAPSKETDYATASYKLCKKPVYDLSKAKVTFWDGDKKFTKMEYTGKELEPPTVKVQCRKNGKGQYVDVPAELYEVSYVNNVNKGTASVVVSANGTTFDGEDCAGSKTVKFKIVAKNLKSLKDLLEKLFGFANS